MIPSDLNWTVTMNDDLFSCLYIVQMVGIYLVLEKFTVLLHSMIPGPTTAHSVA